MSRLNNTPGINRPIKPRRQPKLKVVGSEIPFRVRHIAAWGAEVQGDCLEVFTYAEWDAMHPSDRPEKTALLPGIGRILITKKFGHEWDDFKDVVVQTQGIEQAMRGNRR